MRDAVAGIPPGRPRHGLLPQVSALIRLRWPLLSRRLLITAGVFFAAFVVVALFVDFGAFGRMNMRMTNYLQNRGSTGQNIGLGIFAYLGSIEVTAGIPALLGVPLFRGRRLLAVLPAAFLLAGPLLEVFRKQVIVNSPPGCALPPV